MSGAISDHALRMSAASQAIDELLDKVEELEAMHWMFLRVSRECQLLANRAYASLNGVEAPTSPGGGPANARPPLKAVA